MHELRVVRRGLRRLIPEAGLTHATSRHIDGADRFPPLETPMSIDPWTAPDPQPGDFDADLRELEGRDLASHVGDPEAKLRILLTVEGEDVRRLDLAV